MSISYATDLGFQTHKERSKKTRLIVIHPHTKHRGPLTALFQEEFGKAFYYYAARPGQDKPEAFAKALVDWFAQVVEGFGAKTRAASGADVTALAQALVADFSALAGGRFGLWMDELDHIGVTKAFTGFLKALTEALPTGARLILSTRQLPHDPWMALFDATQAVVLHDFEHPPTLSEQAEVSEDMPALEVYALGAGNALIDGRPIISWDGALPRNLFFFFVDRPLVTRDEVFATFWPDLSVKEATNVFHVTKRKISERLNHELTSYNSGFYIPSGQMRVHYDATAFLEAIEQASTLPDSEAAKRYRYAIDLYRGDFLTGLKMEWAVERRQALKGAYAQALIALGRICKNQGRNEEALGYFLRALHETPEREDIHREVMSLYAQLGRGEDAMAQYRRLEEELQAQLSIAPSRESRELFEQIAASRR